MQHYELLFILPGTLTEDEAAAKAAEVQKAGEEAGVKTDSFESAGKSRLAYPMKHIRYGYFFLHYFQAEGEELGKFEKKLGLMRELLRSMITKYDSKKPPKKEIVTGTPGLGGEPATPRERTSAPVADIPLKRVEKKTEESVKVEEKKPEPVKETKAQDIELGDIDKKLDEILEKDIADV